MFSFYSLLFLTVMGFVFADDCKKSSAQSFSIYQPLNTNPNLTHIFRRNLACLDAYCTGDSFIQTNTLFSDNTKTFNIGFVELQCTSVDSALFHCDLSFIVKTNPNTFHASGIIDFNANQSYLSLTGGSSYWVGIVGGVRLQKTKDAWIWSFRNCYASQSCTGGQLGYQDDGNGWDSYIPQYRTQPLNSSGVVDVISNRVVSIDYAAFLGSDVGKCTNLGDGRSECIWIVNFPDTLNQIALQGSILTASNQSYVTVTGGTGRFHRVKGGGPVDFPTNVSLSFLRASFNPDIFFGCQNTSNVTLSITNNSPRFETFPPLDPLTPPGGVAGSGVLTTWLDDGLLIANSSMNLSSIPNMTDVVSLKGQCTLMNDLLHSLCEWTFVFSSRTDTLNVVGNVILNDPSPFEVVIVGGSGAWSAARGSGVMTADSWEFIFSLSTVPDPNFSSASSVHISAAFALLNFLAILFLS